MAALEKARSQLKHYAAVGLETFLRAEKEQLFYTNKSQKPVGTFRYIQNAQSEALTRKQHSICVLFMNHSHL